MYMYIINISMVQYFGVNNGPHIQITSEHGRTPTWYVMLEKRSYFADNLEFGRNKCLNDTLN